MVAKNRKNESLSGDGGFVNPGIVKSLGLSGTWGGLVWNPENKLIATKEKILLQSKLNRSIVISALGYY